jgi:hypothetical protein
MFERSCVSCHLRLSEIKRQIHEKGQVFFCSMCDASCYYDENTRERFGLLVGAWLIETIDTKDGFLQIVDNTGENKNDVSINHYDGKTMKSFDFLPTEL